MKCCETRTKMRADEEKKSLINRLSRIDGQVRGIQKMVENDIYCIDILTQVAAARSALDGFARELMASHIKSCVAEDIKAGSGEAVDELINTLQKFMK
ncbi:MAG: metal-sensing transcriptional repressor [Oscillospiraceae bacterium]|nr:metal-sensing transcriptional repressor [Oscillospiraceae bacterium]